ncbi:MAG: class I adenylate cyclase, partial [Deferrisomatales bacterium]
MPIRTGYPDPEAAVADLKRLLFGREPAAPAPAAPSELAAAALRAHAAFAAYNRRRRAELARQVGEPAEQALRLLPLLLHVNQPGLPGYVDVRGGCPLGVAGYSPTHADLQLARHLFPGAEPRRTGILQPVVDLVAAMGSAGTVGFSGRSDLDVWVCYGENLGAGTRLAMYRRKVRELEAWLNAHAGVEIHLFLQPTARIRADEFGQTDVEGCGSALGALLKEEFYRTALVLAGLEPSWWVVPPGVDPQAHAAHLEALSRDPGFPSADFVDLGGVARVPLGELFGAAIWQIVKSGAAPFKAALKMGLLEKTVRSGEAELPLCEGLKARVLAGETPDPYCLLFDDVLAHYRGCGDTATEDLLARCFYLKSGVRLDPDRPARPSPSPGADAAAVLGAYVRAWGWGPREVRHLNGFEQWPFEWVQDLAKEVDRYFLRTYQRIRAVLEQSGEAQRITDRDMTILGRKLQARYRRVPHKVETLQLADWCTEEPTLSLYQETLPDGDAPWGLYRGRVTPLNAHELDGEALRSSPDPVELLVWAAQNRILGAGTRLSARGEERDLSSADLEAVARLLTAFSRADAAAPLSELLLSPRTSRLVVIPNLGIEGDALRELGAAYDTTWGETFYRRWLGPDAFRAFADELLLP